MKESNQSWTPSAPTAAASAIVGTAAGPPAEERRLIGTELAPYYVYLLIDPEDGKPFYVGKGTSMRYLDHGREAALQPDPGDGAKLQRIRTIRSRGQEPRIDIVDYGIDEMTAHRIETALIACIGDLSSLTNAVQGHHLRREALQELESRLGAPALSTSTPALLIKLRDWTADVDPELGRVGFGYKPGMSPNELYLSVRAAWVLSPVSARKYAYAVAVHAGLTRGIWAVDHSTWTRYPRPSKPPRWGFNAEQITSGAVFDAFVGPLGRRVPERRPGGKATFPSGGPIAYWPD